MLGELRGKRDLVICDLEAGVGTLLRLQPDQADRVLVVTEPTSKSIEVARRAASIASERSTVTVVANRIRSEEDESIIKSALPHYDVVLVPEEPAIASADRQGLAPIDVDPQAPGVLAIVELGRRLMN